MSKTLKENSFDAAPGGMAGSINLQGGASFATQNSAYQDVGKFATHNYNKYYNPDTTGQLEPEKTDQSGSLDKSVDVLFNKKEKPTADDIITGIQYELQRMIKKDKRIAKERVIDNMKKYGPKYYSKLHMLNIDDKDMDVDAVMQERKNVLDQMISEKSEKRKHLKINDAIQSILQEKMDMKMAKSEELIRISRNKK